MTDLIFGVLLGYCAAVLFPVPVVSSRIIAGWAAVGRWIKGGTAG